MLNSWFKQAFWANSKTWNHQMMITDLNRGLNHHGGKGGRRWVKGPKTRGQKPGIWPQKRQIKGLTQLELSSNDKKEQGKNIKIGMNN